MAIHYLEGAARAVRVDHEHHKLETGDGRTVTISRGHKLTLMCIANSANQDNRVGFPGFDELVLWSGLSRGRQYEVLQDLIDVGLLAKHRDGGRGRRAEFVVFPRGGCCPLHGPLPGHALESADDESPGSGGPEPVPSVDNPSLGSGPSEPRPGLQGPKVGPAVGPAQGGPLPGSPAVVVPELERERSVSRAREREDPPPSSSAVDGPAAAPAGRGRAEFAAVRAELAARNPGRSLVAGRRARHRPGADQPA